nr:MAG TPA: hypothetical protein [Caudoviricetes sp.]
MEHERCRWLARIIESDLHLKEIVDHCRIHNLQ